MAKYKFQAGASVTNIKFYNLKMSFCHISAILMAIFIMAQ